MCALCVWLMCVLCVWLICVLCVWCYVCTVCMADVCTVCMADMCTVCMVLCVYCVYGAMCVLCVWLMCVLCVWLMCVLSSFIPRPSLGCRHFMPPSRTVWKRLSQNLYQGPRLVGTTIPFVIVIIE